ncbi:hypothetical protein D3C87_1999550 [compost metagenome]
MFDPHILWVYDPVNALPATAVMGLHVGGETYILKYFLPRHRKCEVTKGGFGRVVRALFGR